MSAASSPSSGCGTGPARSCTRTSTASPPPEGGAGGPSRAPMWPARPAGSVLSMDTAVVEVRGLRKRYGDRTVVDGVDLDVAEGEIVGLLGANGAGKTTTVECLQGLRRADGGTVRVLGLDPALDGPRVR